MAIDCTLQIAPAPNCAAYDTVTGRFIAAAGGHGDGPGEFQYLSWMGKCGQSPELVTFDPGHRRVSIFSLLDGSRSHDAGFSLVKTDTLTAWTTGKQPVAASLPDGFVFGTSDAWSLSVHDVRGVVIDSLRLDRERMPVHATEIDEYHTKMLEAWRRAGQPEQWLNDMRRAYERHI